MYCNGNKQNGAVANRDFAEFFGSSVSNSSLQRRKAHLFPKLHEGEKIGKKVPGCDDGVSTHRWRVAHRKITKNEQHQCTIMYAYASLLDL